MSTSGRLTKVYKQAERICFGTNDRFVIMSDCHRGIGNSGDNFLKNRHIYLSALRYYNRRRFTYLELGDGDELWENKEMEQILQVHRDVFALLKEFYNDGRLYMLYGNHDKMKKRSRFIQKQCEGFYCEESGKYTECLPGIEVKEGLILEECGTGQKIFLVHGHQGDLFNDTLWRINCFLVRHVWRKLELIGMENPMSASGSGKKKTKVERRLTEWANNNHQMMITGHTHRVKFPSDAENYYFNDGSCVRPYSITGIELENGVLRLVEWSVMTSDAYSLYVGRQVLDEVNMERFDNK